MSAFDPKRTLVAMGGDQEAAKTSNGPCPRAIGVREAGLFEGRYNLGVIEGRLKL